MNVFSVKSLMGTLVLLSLWTNSAVAQADLGKTPPVQNPVAVEASLCFNDGYTKVLETPEWPEAQQRIADIVQHILSANGLERITPVKVILWPNPESSMATMSSSGLILIYSGLIDYVQDDSELAWALAHEIVHFQKHHKDSLDMLSKELNPRNDEDSNDSILLAATRHKEFEADKLGLRYAITAGYSRSALVDAVSRRGELAKAERFDSTEAIHPSYNARAVEGLKYQKSFENLTPKTRSLNNLAEIRRLMEEAAERVSKPCNPQ